MIKDQILEALKRASGEKGIHLEFPEREEFGDYSTNIALHGKNRNPREYAQELAAKLQKDKELSEIVEKIEVAGPGFINFYLKKDFLIKNLSGMGESYGKLETGGKKIMIEFTDPNPFKEFHIGHLYSNSVGESICRILEAAGNVVRRANYQGDIGLHVAKSIWGMKKKFIEEKTSLARLSQKTLAERIKFLGQAYSLGANAYEEDENSKDEINTLNKKIFELSPEIKEFYETGRKWSLEYFETIYKRLGTKFDYYYYESEVGEIGVQIVRQFLQKGVFEKSQGAIVFPGEKYGLHTRVFINSMGLPTYEAKELGLAPTKYKDFAYDLSIIITANEIDEYFKVLIAALKLVSPELGNQTVHLSHGMVKLPEGKMSSRTGKILTGEWLLDEAKKSIQERHKSDEKTAEKIAVGAVKYALLKSSIGQDIIFNFDESVSIEGNSGPYLQYTHARTQSVLQKAGSKSKSPGSELNHEELVIVRTLIKFPEVVAQAAEAYSPNIICNYLHDLAQKYNTFYNADKIIGSGNESFRLTLTKATGTVLKNGLKLLGIEAPERM